MAARTLVRAVCIKDLPDGKVPISTLHAIHQGDTGTFQQEDPGVRECRGWELPFTCRRSPEGEGEAARRKGDNCWEEVFPPSPCLLWRGKRVRKQGVQKNQCLPLSLWTVQAGQGSPGDVLSCSAPASTARLGPHLGITRHGIWAAKCSRESAGGPEVFFNIFLNLRNTFQET